MFKNSVITSYSRTAIGSFGGSLKDKTTVELASEASKAAIMRSGISSEEVDEVVMGCVGQYGVNSFLARLVGLKSGCSNESTGQTVNRLCASGLQAIITGAMMIENGDADVILAGGAENMSQYPYLLPNARFGMRMGIKNNAIEDSLTTALCEPFTNINTHIGVTAENIAEMLNISRTDIDQYAFESQQKALSAIDSGKFKDEIVPVEIKVNKEIRFFDTDEHPRQTTVEKLSKLNPFITPEGIVTAGNSSGINDAAAAFIIMSREKAELLGCTPIARIVDYAVAGVSPSLMGLGPVASTKKLLAKTGMNLQDIGLVELNEAFAAQAIGCIRELGLDPNIVNVNGSGISLGHPIGATGAIISIKLIEEMRRRNIRFGLATLCIGGGQGLSVIYELV